MKTVCPLWGQSFRFAAGLPPGVPTFRVLPHIPEQVFEAAAVLPPGVLILGVLPHFPEQVFEAVAP